MKLEKQQPSRNLHTHTYKRFPLSRDMCTRLHIKIIMYLYNLYTKTEQYIPASSEGCCLNPKGWCIGTPYHPFNPRVPSRRSWCSPRILGLSLVTNGSLDIL